MRIAIDGILLTEQRTGVGQYIYNLVKNLTKLDTKNDYLLFADSRFQNEELEAKNLVIRKIKLSNPTYQRIWWEQFYLPGELKRENITLCHFPCSVSSLLSPVPSVVTLHELSHLVYPEVFPKLKRLYYTTFTSLSLKKAKKVITVSNSTKQELIKFYNISQDKIEVVYNGIDESFKVLDKELAKKEIYEKFNLKDRFILYAGIVGVKKNIIRLIQAFAHLKEDGLKLVIAGPKGWGYLQILKVIKELGLEEKILFLGYVDRKSLIDFYNTCEVFIYPCLYEGFGFPILEAMACGTPVITSDISALPEVAGEAAILVDPLRVDELTKAINRVLNDVSFKEQMIEKGLRRVKEFSWGKAARETLMIYQKLCLS